MLFSFARNYLNTYNHSPDDRNLGRVYDPLGLVTPVKLMSTINVQKKDVTGFLNELKMLGHI